MLEAELGAREVADQARVVEAGELEEQVGAAEAEAIEEAGSEAESPAYVLFLVRGLVGEDASEDRGGLAGVGWWGKLERHQTVEAAQRRDVGAGNQLQTQDIADQTDLLIADRNQIAWKELHGQGTCQTQVAGTWTGMDSPIGRGAVCLALGIPLRLQYVNQKDE